MRRVKVYPWQEEREAFEGWFHVWAGTSERAYAVVELDSGLVVACEGNDKIVFSTPVENLWKTCANPVDAPAPISGYSPDSPVSPVQPGMIPELVRDVHGTGTHDFSDHLNVTVPTSAPGLPPLTPLEFLPLARSPFHVENLSAAQRLAVSLMVGFWRLQKGYGRSLSLSFDEFREQLHDMTSHLLDPAGQPEPSEVWQEAWSPEFWRTRPELVVGKLTIGPAPAILGGGEPR